MEKANSAHFRIPAWAAVGYVLFSAVLIPWTVYLSLTLPRHHLSAHWDVSWAGLDVALIMALGSTGFLAWLRSKWVIVASSVAGSLLLVDAWFDVMSQRAGLQLDESLILALFVEIPLAILCFITATRVLSKNIAVD